MSAEHNHPPFCCCHGLSPHKASERPCPGCPEHGRANCVTTVDGWCRTCSTADGPVYHREDAPAATPYTEQETTK